MQGPIPPTPAAEHERNVGSPGSVPDEDTHGHQGSNLVPEPLQPVLQLLTQGLNVHATRLDALARAVTRLERGAVQQAEAAEAARAQAERRCAEAYARAEAAEANAEAKLAASDARHAAAQASLEARLSELESRLEAVPPSLEELRGRYAQHELARAAHERELSARAAEIAEAREAHASLATRVDACAMASALATAEAEAHAAQSALREQAAEQAAQQRKLAMQTNALQEGHSQLHGLLSEQQAAVTALQSAATSAASEAEATRGAVRDLSAAQQQLEADQAQVTDTVQLGLARAVASAEATRDDSERVSSGLAEIEGWSRRLERLEADLSAAERKVEGAADEMRRQATHLEGSQRNSMLQASQQVALHVKALSGDLLRELNSKATIADTQQLFDAMHKQFLSLREAHRALVAHVEAQANAAETVAEEAAAAALQANGALASAEKTREETHAWLQMQLQDRPTLANIESIASDAAVRALGGGSLLPPPPSHHQQAYGPPALTQEQVRETATAAAQQVMAATVARQAAAAATTPAPLSAPQTPGGGVGSGGQGFGGVPAAGTPLGAMLSHVRELFAVPLEVRIEALELSRRRVEVALDEICSQRWKPPALAPALEQMHEQLREQLKGELSRKLPSLEQVETLQTTLSNHIQRLPIVASFPHGRWTWTRGKPLRSAGGRSQPPLIPWTNEKLNTSPSTFGWGVERAYVEVLAPGMYVVSCAVFMAGAPTIGVSVNGQTVLRRSPSAKQVQSDASGSIVGISVRDVLSLMSGSRIAVSVELPIGSGHHLDSLRDAHGLIEIKKLW